MFGLHKQQMANVITVVIKEDKKTSAPGHCTMCNILPLKKVRMK